MSDEGLFDEQDVVSVEAVLSKVCAQVEGGGNYNGPFSGYVVYVFPNGNAVAYPTTYVVTDLPYTTIRYGVGYSESARMEFGVTGSIKPITGYEGTVCRFDTNFLDILSPEDIVAPDILDKWRRSGLLGRPANVTLIRSGFNVFDSVGVISRWFERLGFDSDEYPQILAAAFHQGTGEPIAAVFEQLGVARFERIAVKTEAGSFSGSQEPLLGDYTD